MDIKLVATDLDYTLLRRDKGISEYTKSVFARCREKGILIAFATARSEKGAARFSSQTAPDIFISNNGARARMGSEELYKAVISPDALYGLIERCRDDPGILQISLEADNGFYDSKPAILTLTSGWLDTSHMVITDFSELLDYGGVYKITIRTEDTALPKTIAQEFPAVIYDSTTGEDWYIFRDRYAVKEKALTILAAKLGINMANIAAFGDEVNDIGMLRAAGTAVAVENAIPEAKAAADYICGDCDEDGVARWIENYIL